MKRALNLFATLAIAGCAASSAEPATPAPTGGAAAAATPAAEPPPAAPVASSRTFSDEQADRGRDVFRATCTECHYSSEFSDSQFQFKWSRRSAGNLYQLIQTSMPETAPGSLTDQETVDLVSYMLRMNGFEPGTGELPADRAVLDAMSLASIRN